MTEYSIIIRDGTVFDGKGNKPEIADIGVQNGLIAKVGNLEGERADLVINAAGKYVTPGFIDLTTHSDTHWSVFTDPGQESFIGQGVTTIVGGNCGFSLAPFTARGSIEEVERWVNVSEVNINWRTMGEFLSEMEGHPIGVNFATLVGLTTIRRGISERQGGVDDEELKTAEYLLKESLKEGAFGLSTNFGIYEMKSFADSAMIELCGILEKNNAILKHHLEDEGRELLPAVSRVLALARGSKAKSHISHFRALGKTSSLDFPKALLMLNRIRGEGIKITCDFFPYTNTDSDLLFLLPPWARKMEHRELTALLSDQKDERRAAILLHLKDLTLHYESVIVASGAREVGVTGKTLDSISQNLGISGEEAILRLLIVNNLNVRIFSDAISAENIELVAREDYAAVSSDGPGYDKKNFPGTPRGFNLPHPRSFGTFPRALQIFAKESGILDWASAIHKMTGLPATILGVSDRGLIARNCKADIIIFDPLAISAEPNYEEPREEPKGVLWVLVNGEVALREGNLTGALSGRVLRKYM